MFLSINRWIDSQIVYPIVYPRYNGISLPIKRNEVVSDAYENLDEPQKHDAKWKKPDTKATCYMIPSVQNDRNSQVHRDTKWINGCLGLKRREEQGSDCLKSVEYPFEVMKNFSNYKMVMIVQPCEYTKSHWILHFNIVNIMICKLSQ